MGAVLAVFGVALVLIAGGMARRYPAQIRSAVATVLPIAADPIPAAVAIQVAVTPAPAAAVEEKAENTTCSIEKAQPTVAAEPPPANAADNEVETALRDKAQTAVISRNWPAAVDAARMWAAKAPSRRSRLFLARVLVHTHECRQAVEVLAPEMAEQPRSIEVRSVLDLCKLPPAEAEKQAPAPRPKDRAKLARVERP